MYVGLRIDVSLVQSKEEKKPKTHECRHIMRPNKTKACWKDESKELKQEEKTIQHFFFFCYFEHQTPFSLLYFIIF